MNTRKRLTHMFAVIALTLAILFGGTALQPVNHSSAARDVSDGSRFAVLTSSARTATGTSSTVCQLGRYTKYAMALVVTAASGTTPTLDVTWQHSIDGGTNWFTVVAFTQATTTTTALKVESEVEAATAEVWGDCMRVSYTIGGTTPSFTFKIDLYAN